MKTWIETEWERQRHNLILWCPAFFATGIWLYFFLPFEPRLNILVPLGIVSVMAAIGAILVQGIFRVAVLTLLLLTTGYLCATYRSFSIAAPILEFRYYGPVEGRIVKIDRSSSGAQRLTLDRVVMPDLRYSKTPERVRVSLFGYVPDQILHPGMRVNMVANMSPPGSPVEPGGFDFRQMAWFSQIGGVGFTRNPVLEMRPYADTGLWLMQVRVQISTHISEMIGGQNGAFSAAILTGERRRIDPDVLGQLRASNLAHLLAISGLHMGLLTGFVYMIVRYGMALFPRAVLYFPAKKLGAVAALAAGLAYLFISGSSVATQRSFIMVAVVLVAVMLDRPAFTLRAVALAAMIVLIARPESLNGAGFQMSFAATTALIGVFDWLRRKNWWKEARYGRFARLMPFVALVITSTVAGLATAPISAYHFNQLSNFGLAANLLSVPVMGMVVMPAAVVAGVLSVFGWQEPAFWLMGQGVGWILAVAEYFATLPNAVTLVKSAAGFVLPMVAIAGCLFFLVQGWFRVSGLVLFGVAIAFWSQTSRPLVLIDQNGSLLGVLTAEGRVLNKDKAYRFAAGSWLENDGDGILQFDANQREGLSYDETRTTANLRDGWVLVLERSKPFDMSCADNEIFVAPKWENPPPGGCYFIGKNAFSTGAIAIDIVEAVPNLRLAAPEFPQRPWNNAGHPYQ